MSTTLTYNGIAINYAQTKDFSQEIVHDESQSDTLFHKFTIGVVGYVHTQDSPVRITPSGTNPVSTQIAVRQALMEERRDFRFVVGGTTLLAATPAAANNAQPYSVGVDVNNGPMPKHCNITKISGDLVFRVEFVIVVCIIDCMGSTNDSGVLNNRWSVSESFDEDWYSTREITGTLRVANRNLNPQSFRGWVVPPLQATFKRERMQFVTSKDGLELAYTITDKQVFSACPYPGTTWEATHTESTGDGVTMFGDVRIAIKGPPKSDKKVLIQLAAQIMEFTLRIFPTESDDIRDYQMIQAAVIDFVHDSKIEMSARVQRTGSDTKTIFNIIGGTLGRKLFEGAIDNYAPERSRVPTDADLPPLLGLFICHAQTPCNNDHAMPQSTAATETKKPLEGQRGPDVIAYEAEGNLPTYPNPKWSSEHATAPYTHYEIKKKYLLTGGRLPLPMAGVQADVTAATTKIARLHGTIARLVVNIRAQRTGAKPVLPTLDDFNDITGVASLLRVNVSPDGPRLSPDAAGEYYAAEADYIYALARAPRPGEITSGRYPLMTYDSDEKLKLSANEFSGSILGSSSG